MIRGIFGSGVADEIVPRLYQGGCPQNFSDLAPAGVGLLVLCAQELQPEPEDVARFEAEFPQVEIVCAPMDDQPSGPTPEEIRTATAAASTVLRALRSGKTALVTCQAGRNRSGLVNALVLVRLYGISGSTAAERVRRQRPNALTNPGFSAFLDGIGAAAGTKRRY